MKFYPGIHKYDRYGRYLTSWNPLREWCNNWNWCEASLDATRSKAIVEKECQEINSMTQVKFFNYTKTVTSSKIGLITFPIQASIMWDDIHVPQSINPEVLANTVKSILDCIQSRLEGKPCCNNYTER